MRLSLKVIPSSSRDCVSGWLGDTLKVRVRAPAEKGKANKAVQRVLATALGVAEDQVLIVKGITSEHKTVEITGIDEAQVRNRITDASNSKGG